MDNNQNYEVQLPFSGKALAAMICGIASIPGSCSYGLVGLACAIVSMVLLKQVEPISGQIRNASMLKPAKICSIIGLCCSIVMIVFWIIYVIVVAAFSM
jgi:hypothetical protein